MGIADIITGVQARVTEQALLPFDATTQAGVIADGTIRWVAPGETETLGLPCAIEVSAWEAIRAKNQPQLVMTNINFGFEAPMPDALGFISSFILPR